MGVIGDFRARGQVFTYVKVDKENWVALRVCMAVWGVCWGPLGSQMVDLRIVEVG